MKILRITEVARKTALSPSSIYKQIRLGNFPKGTKITARATGWSSEVGGLDSHKTGQERAQTAATKR